MAKLKISYKDEFNDKWSRDYSLDEDAPTWDKLLDKFLDFIEYSYGYSVKDQVKWESIEERFEKYLKEKHNG